MQLVSCSAWNASHIKYPNNWTLFFPSGRLIFFKTECRLPAFKTEWPGRCMDGKCSIIPIRTIKIIKWRKKDTYNQLSIVLYCYLCTPAHCCPTNSLKQKRPESDDFRLESGDFANDFWSDFPQGTDALNTGTLSRPAQDSSRRPSPAMPWSSWKKLLGGSVGHVQVPPVLGGPTDVRSHDHRPLVPILNECALDKLDNPGYSACASRCSASPSLPSG